jgi:probable HAF family extracellular repeat protein
MYPVDHLGGGSSVVVDMNNFDQVAGNSETADGSIHAFLWTLGEDERGIIRDLGTLGGSNSFATGINEAGQVVGYSETGAFYTEQGIDPVPVWHAFLWDKGVMYDLGVHNDFYDYPFVQPYPFSEAVDINAGGDVAGNSMTINSHYRGFYLLPDFP